MDEVRIWVLDPEAWGRVPEVESEIQRFLHTHMDTIVEIRATTTRVFIFARGDRPTEAS